MHMFLRIRHLGLGSSPWAVRCLPVPSAGVASGASTCSPPPAPVSTCWGSGGGKSGNVTSTSGAGSAGVDPSGAAGLGAGAAMTGPTPEDPSWVEDPGTGVVEAGVSWRSAALAALMKPKSVNTQVERSKCLLCNQRQTHSVDFFLMALFHPQGLSRRLRCGRRGFTSQRCGPRHGDGDGCGG
jgi:hypothetical protein